MKTFYRIPKLMTCRATTIFAFQLASAPRESLFTIAAVYPAAADRSFGEMS